ncbi:type IV pilus twitching motility protein PilT [Dehalococcoides mccartyi]|uniref:type IV pilus twitching motility protein PilT n=1 Tax=Dehalococcoides mccartyi TaxID=61435 RepID=UPI0001BDC939|nr:type IV pilus twitching motility protein PilT [Dehalococcoides mccartyi]AGG08209.1 ATPase, PilT family [Dehalococcoides mccartyi BTF08]AQU06245.1 type IV pili twitching motility protein PilT [Dehalococcoides mccartyi]AQU07688.1 type IV pili twitching motility protein PilT [Dehalococcoides mccartyi]AQW62718.1 type IV pili twitching motility protein PilT [Dehalococcoides mccartyi]AQX73509.1 type IV pili twitching motility protein PilT [Dehalococcoides mccartyi]
MIEIYELLKLVVDKDASDLHIKAPTSPVLRINGDLIRQPQYPPITPEDAEQIFKSITTPHQQEVFASDNELDFVYSVTNLARFRVNVLRQRGSLSLAFRVVPFVIRNVDELNLPPILKSLIIRPRGLLLVTGPTGSGKSTTQAAMIEHLNNCRRSNVITIEDPIEYLFHDNECIISQRELGGDTRSFAIALKHALRHDPNVIVIGEMRDLETISTAIAAAETGHLVIGTLHTTDAPQTVDRLIDMFPPSQQQQIRLQLSQVLEAIISQTLIPRMDNKGRVAAFEILVANNAARNLIREGKTFELLTVMQLGKNDGMQTLDNELTRLAKEGIISVENAVLKSSNPERLRKSLSNLGHGA